MPILKKRTPIALTIAGSDSGGGAGIQADLKTFAALGVHGTSVITCLTAQNPRRVTSVSAVPTGMIRRQLEAVFAELPPDAIKTGMLYSETIIRAVAVFLRSLRRRPKLIVDPVLVATSGARLLKQSAILTFSSELLPMADLITPNLPEAEALTGLTIREPEDMRTAARKLHRQYRCGVVVKGGHLPGTTTAIDIFFDGRNERMLTIPFVRGAKLHGTGCTFSAAVTAWCARGYGLVDAVRAAKDFVTEAIHKRMRAGRHEVLRS